VESKILEVTPEMAAGWLKNNPRNRNLNAKVVDDLARAILQGNWALNGEAIKLSSDGQLLDGQHRLSAIVKSGATVEMLVVTGLEPWTQDTMDTGRKRTTADVLAIHGEGNTNVLAAVTKRVWMLEQGNHKFANFSSPSTLELMETLERFPTLRRSTEIGVRVNSEYRAAGASVTGTAHHILHRVDESDAAEFFARLGTGAELPLEHPLLTLRRRLQRDRDTSKRYVFHATLGLYIRTWNAIREDRTLGQLIQPPEANMPMPV
jgi:hypothetical protein